MTIEQLNEAGSTTLESGAMEVELTVSSNVPVRLLARTLDGDPLPSPQLQPTTWLVPEQSAPFEIVIRSGSAEEFPDGTEVTIVFRNVSGSRTVLGPKTDISGIDEAGLATVVPGSNRFTTVQLLKVDDVRPDPLLPPLARAAQFAARRLVHTGRAVRIERGLMLCIDTSASMVVHRNSGLLQVMAEVVLGADRGLGDGGDVPVLGVVRKPNRWAPLGSINAAGYVDQFWPKKSETGFRASSLAGMPGLDADKRTVLVVTDALPPDVRAFAEQWANQPNGAHFRLIVLGPLSESDKHSASSAVEIDTTLTAERLLEHPGHRANMAALVSDLVGESALRGRA